MSDLDLTPYKQALADIKGHKHPETGQGGDLYCLNLKAWLGDQAPALIAEVEQLRGLVADHIIALADAQNRPWHADREGS